MKVCIVAPSPVPFTPGGAERLFAGLADAFARRNGIDVELVKLPAPERNFGDLVTSYAAFSRLDLSHFDLVVSTKYPSWMVRHPNHVVYMVHPLRGVYDAYQHFGLPLEPELPLPTEAAALLSLLKSPPNRDRVPEILTQAAVCASSIHSDHPSIALPSPLLRQLIRWLDSAAMATSEVQRHLGISETVINRTDYFPSETQAIAVVPPSSLSIAAPSPGDTAPFMFTASRLDSPKRIDLIIDAMQHVDSPIELRIAGTGAMEDELRQRAAHDPRIRMVGRISEEELAVAYADATAVLFTPLDEDLGYITLEAHMSHTPVITTTDSGGPTDLVDHGVSGLIVDPTPSALGVAIDQLAANPAKAQVLGDAGWSQARHVTWDNVIDMITDGTDSSDPLEGSTRRRVVVLATYPIVPALGGGQLRCRHLFEPLSRDRDVVFICLGFPGERSNRTQIAPGIAQIVVERSGNHAAAELELETRSGIPVSDIAASMFIHLTPQYLAELRTALSTADVAILAQPYLYPALIEVDPDVPTVYDSQNDEVALKSALLPRDALGARLLDVVRAVEEGAIRHGDVTACSAEEVDRYDALWPGAEPTLIPNGADIAGREFVRFDQRRANLHAWRSNWTKAGGAPFDHLATFVGSLHPPNLDAVETIIQAAPRSPTVLFLIVGSQCAYFEGRALPSNVVMSGRVDDNQLEQILRTADIALNPMRLGAGTNLKTLEYFAAGLPVVSTAIGMRGTRAMPGVHYVEMSTEVDLPEALAACVDETSVRSMTVTARELVEEKFDWSDLAEQFRRVVEDCATRAPISP